MCRFYEQGKEREPVMVQFKPHRLVRQRQGWKRSTAMKSCNKQYRGKHAHVVQTIRLLTLKPIPLCPVNTSGEAEEREKAEEHMDEKVKKEELKDSSAAPDSAPTGLD